MYQTDTCPTCMGADFQVLHQMKLEDNYQEPERVLNKTNDYQRNYILFRDIFNNTKSSIDVTFLLCKGCGLIFFSPRPDDADLAIKYAKIVQTGETEKREDAFKLVDLRLRRSREIVSRMRRHLQFPINDALDIGGADGHCLAAFSNGQSRLAVLDFEDREMWPGVTKIGRTLDDLKPGEEFDVVLCCHTLEHIPDIPAFINQLHRHVLIGGLLYIEVPRGCNGEIFHTRNLLTHLNFFSKASLSYLLGQNGFYVEECKDGPVLSRKRYLDVIYVVARRLSDQQSVTASGSAYQETLRESRKKGKLPVLISNVLLVLRHPIAYVKAFQAQRRRVTQT